MRTNMSTLWLHYEYIMTQVMQFGRIDANAYTLDFQYPLTAIQVQDSTLEDF